MGNSEKITIIALIYQSTEYADFLYENIHRHTVELQNGEAEFCFIANDANTEVVEHLEKKKYPYLVNNNVHYSEAELFNMGYAFPEYINRVYAGYNFGIKKSDSDIIVLVNSDNAFSPAWLTNMRSRLNRNTIVSPVLVQPHQFVNPKNRTECVIKDCGNSISTFDETKFLSFSESIKVDSVVIGNPFMPLMLYKEQAELVGFYPEGNIHAGHYNHILLTGDHAFINKLESIGIRHITCMDSIVYHFQEGEKYKKL